MNGKRIANLLLNWYASHYRSLPWRVNASPYHVWVSEIMLQQTRIEAVVPYYQRFIHTLPTIRDLANAQEETLLKLWEGLGYYSRVRNMQKAAKFVVDHYDGNLPADYDLLLALPGVGPYTAGAIASIAYSIPVPAVDGNVMRVLSRLSGNDTDVLSTAGKKLFTDMAWELVPEQHPGRFNQALMELGEVVCLPNGTPRCEVCPLNRECIAFCKHRVDELPVRIKKTKRRVEKRSVIIALTSESEPRVLLHRRSASGLLAGLWEFPNTLEDNPLSALPETVVTNCQETASLPDGKHLFSHIEWQMRGYRCMLAPAPDLPEDYALVTWCELQERYPIPGAFRCYTELLPKLMNEEK